MQISAGDYEALQLKYDESKAALALLSRLLEVNDGFQSVDQHIASKNYIEATREHAAVSRIINELEITYGDRLKVLDCLTSKCAAQGEKLETSVLRHWHSIVQWQIPGDNKKNCPVELKIVKSDDSFDAITACAQSLQNLSRLEEVMKLFGEKLMKYFFRELFCNRGANFTVNKEIGTIVMTVTQVLDGSHTDAVLHVVEQLKVLMITLNVELLNVSVTVDIKSAGGTQAAHSKTLMSVIGDQFAGEFSETFIRECLSRSIPSNRAGLAAYSDVIFAVEHLEEKLAEFHFTGDSDKTLSTYVKNVEVLFSNKRCQEVLESARSMMKSDIYNTVTVSDEDRGTKAVEALPLLPGDAGSSSAAKKTKLSSAMPNGVKLDSVFVFPSCQISVTAHKLVQMGYSVLKEATTGIADSSVDQTTVPAQTAIQLFYCVHAMFEMFASVVPVYHRERLNSVPQMAAVHHNDCMYIAHHLMLLGHQFQRSLPEPLCLGAATFVDLIPVLRRSGTKCFLEQMLRQKDQILQSLRSAHGKSNYSLHFVVIK